MTFIEAPITVDPDDLAADAFAYISEQYPGWVPNAGNLDTWLLEAAARYAAVVGTTAAAVTTAIFRYFGKLVGVLPLDATPASTTTAWTAIDDRGYTIPAGTVVGITAADGTRLAFSVLADTVIAPGDTDVTDVTVIAISNGAAGSDLGEDGDEIELISEFDFIDTVTLEATTTGGVDAEDDDAYLSRLAAELQLLTPRPIVPDDFSALAHSIAGVARALAIDLYVPSVNERQTVLVDATSGDFTLTFDGDTTAAIVWDADAATIQAALEALGSIDPGDVSCTGGPVNVAAVTVEFTGALAGTDVGAMTSDASGLAGGATTATVATVNDGAAAVTDAPRAVTVALVDVSGNEVTSLTKSAVKNMLQALREVNFLVYVIDPTYTSIDASFTIDVAAGFDEDAVVAAAEAAVAAWLAPAAWGLPSGGDQSGWIDTDTVGILNGAAVVKNVQGVQSVVTFQLAIHDDSLGDIDITLPGPAPLPRAGDITGDIA